MKKINMKTNKPRKTAKRSKDNWREGINVSPQRISEWEDTLEPEFQGTRTFHKMEMDVFHYKVSDVMHITVVKIQSSSDNIPSNVLVSCISWVCNLLDRHSLNALK